MLIFRVARITAVTLPLCLVATISMADQMSGEELSALYSTDVTECGEYLYKNKLTPYCEHWQLDGKIVGKDHMMYAGEFHIKEDDALICKKYGNSKEYCVPLVHISGDTYTTTFSDGSQADVIIVEGDTQNFN